MKDTRTQPEGGHQAGGAPPDRRDRRARLILPVLSLLSALFFAAALAYAVGSGLLGSGGDHAADRADREKRTLPRDWANMIPLRPLDPDLNPGAGDSGAAGANEDSGSRPADGATAPAGAVAVAGPAPAATPPRRATPAPLRALPQRVPLLRVTRRRLPNIADLTPSRPSVPELPGTGGGFVPDIDVLPGGVRIPPILPGGVQIPPILPGGVPIPPIDPLPGVPGVPPVDPFPGGGGSVPLPGGGALPLPGGLPSPLSGRGQVGATGVAPLLPLGSVALRQVAAGSAGSSAGARSEPDAGQPARLERRKDPTARAVAASRARVASKRRAARRRLNGMEAAPRSTEGSRVSDTGGSRGRPRPDRRRSQERRVAREPGRGRSEGCGDGRGQRPLTSSGGATCGEARADTGESSGPEPEPNAPDKSSRDRRARAERDAGI